MVTANGGTGNLGTFGGSGGGSGGGIFIHAPIVTLAGTVSADGGDGGGDGIDGTGKAHGVGGGGGGGIIRVQASTYYDFNASLNVSGGISGEVNDAGGEASVDPTGAVGIVNVPTTSTGPVALVYIIPTDGNSHNITLELDLTGTDILVVDDDSGQVLNSLPAADVNQVQITGGANEDNYVTIDYTNGFFTVPVSFDGGTGTGTHAAYRAGRGRHHRRLLAGPQ